MFSLETLIMVAAIVLCLGGLLGAIISRTLIPPSQQKGLEQNLQSARDELDRYQQDVASHFAETSRLVSNLTASYRDVHEHLAKGAISLTNAEITQKILDAGEPSIGIESNEILPEGQFEPPKDWAPKTPGQKGTLSEDYGLDELRDEAPMSENAKQSTM